MAIQTFVFKVASRCNINCSYCYVYNAGDLSWRRQPTFMSVHVAQRAIEAIASYAVRQGIERVVVNFHGGEPLLLGAARLDRLLGVVQDGAARGGVGVDTAIQTNGVLLTPATADLLRRRSAKAFLSIDGPPETNDAYRRDHAGRGTGEAASRALAALATDCRDVFAGCLAVVDPTTDPDAVTDFLLAADPPVLDFLLPLHNHDRPPAHPARAYGRWLAAAFDRWVASGHSTRVRTFEQILHRIYGPAAARDDGFGSAEAVIVETNGALEADDTLKTAFDGAATLGLNVFEHTIEEAERHPRLTVGSHRAGLASACRSCPHLTPCGAGHLSHRFASERGFANPSVYCDGLIVLIEHIRTTVGRALQAAA